VEITVRPHRHRLGHFDLLENEQLRFSNDHHLFALDRAVRDLFKANPKDAFD
jgi:hypothetical protein